LPKRDSEASVVAFCLQTPEILDSYSKFLYKAQKCLVPDGDVPKAPESTNLWASYCNSCGFRENFKNSFLEWYSDVLKPPKQYGPTNVTAITSVDEVLWYPDGLITQFTPGDNLNPFAVSKENIQVHFVEKLKSRKELQWALKYPKNGSIDGYIQRVNYVFEKVSSNPQDFMKEVIFHLGI
jgi:hypothetical protein